MKIGIYILTFLVGQSLCFAQKELKVAVNQTIVINKQDYLQYIHVLATENKVKPKDHLYYYWYKANDVKITRGDFDGELLHGVYMEFYLNKNLKQKGEFRYGLRHGEWKSWYMNGEYSEVSNWKKGKKQGKLRLYNEQGKLVKICKYKDDDLHGKYLEVNTDGKEEIKYYKNGVLVTKEKNGFLKKLKFRKKKNVQKDSE